MRAWLSLASLLGGIVLLTAACATSEEWSEWRGHTTHFAIVDRFLYVANERSHTVVTFALDPATGMPVPTGDVLPTPSPTCVLPWPA